MRFAPPRVIFTMKTENVNTQVPQKRIGLAL